MPQPASPLAKRGRNGATRAPSPSMAQFCVGVVAQRDGIGGLRVRSGGAILHARRAASCLLEPAPGDSVACLQCDPGEAWVTAVLSSWPPLDQVISVADCSIESRARPLAKSLLAVFWPRCTGQ